MFAGTGFCVFLIFLSACKSEENFPESPGEGNWPSAEGMQQVEKKESEMLEALMHPEENRCYGKQCRANEDCCVGAVCVDIEGGAISSFRLRTTVTLRSVMPHFAQVTGKVSGTCLPMYGKKFFQACEQDKDCTNGFVCLNTGNGNFDGPKTCQLEGRIMKKKAFNDPCSTSSECDASRGLCCQVLRRHRMASKKVCHYFIDPLSCIGEVETDLKPLNYIPNPFFKARLG